MLDARPDQPQALSGLAWILATAADSSLRNSDKAIELAERASALTDGRNLSVLDALAAAYASAGRFDAAVAVVDRGIKIATDARLDAAVTLLRERRDLYIRGQPYRQSKLL